MTEIYEELELKSRDHFSSNEIVFSRTFNTRSEVENFKQTRTNTRIKRRHEHNHGRVNKPCKIELL